MDMAHFLSKKLKSLARIIEKPELVAVRKKGVFLDMYELLDLNWLKEKNFATVLDIGASVGHFSAAAHAAFPKARVYAFEPLPDHFEQLQQRLSHIPASQAFNLALGEQSGRVSFERSSGSDSSSVLKMSEAHRAAFPETCKSQTTTVQMECLDEIAKRMDLKDPLLIKIDVQGYEDRVLRGGEQTIKRAEVIIVETSLVTLYEGQPLFDDVLALLKTWGFHYAGAFDQLCHPRSGQVLQVDAIFVRR